MSGRRVLAGALACLLLAACAADETSSESTPAPESDGPPAFSAEVQELCTPVFDRFKKMRKATGKRRIRKTAAAVTGAERKLVERLREVEAPPGAEELLAAYIDTLQEYSNAQVVALKVRGPAARSFDEIVTAAKIGVRLSELSERIGLPSACPPLLNAYTALFVTKANRNCFEIRNGLTKADVPRTRDEAIELLDSAHRATAEVASALQRARPPRSSLRVGRIVTLGKERMRTLARVRDAVVAGDLAAFEAAWPDLVDARRRLMRQMLTVGLVSCAKTFGLLGI